MIDYIPKASKYILRRWDWGGCQEGLNTEPEEVLGGVGHVIPVFKWPRHTCVSPPNREKM